MKFLFSRLVLLFAVLISTDLAWGQSQGMGRLSQFLPQTGQQDIWSWTNTGSSFAMANLSDPGAVTYFYVLPENRTEGRRLIETEVSLSNVSQGGAGLIFAFDPTSNDYFAYAVEASGAVKMFRRDQNGFAEIADFGFKANRGAPNSLAVVESADKVELFLNGDFMGAVQGVTGGGVGIVGLGLVDARFASFSERLKDNASLPKSEPQRADAVARPADQGALRLVPIQIVDQTAPFGPTVAFDAMIPQGWTPDGGVVWNPPNGCHKGGRLVWGVNSPDKTYGIGMLPPISWSANNYGGALTGCVNADLADAEAVMHTYFDLSQDAQARIVEITRPPELGFVAQQLGAQLPALAGRKHWTDGVLVRADVVEDGRVREAYILAFTLHWEIANPDGWGQGGVLLARGGNMILGLAIATPPGKLDEGHPGFAAILGNLRARPQWNQGVAQWWARQNRPSGGGAPNTSAASDSGSITDMMFESWKRRDSASDAGHSKTVSGIWETQNYQSSSGVVALSQDYGSAWELNDGSLVLTNDLNFNPMETFNELGSQLQPVQ
ncbi:MAG: hypothetical protein AAFV19_23815 [Pseudomonadota bacterium]